MLGVDTFYNIGGLSLYYKKYKPESLPKLNNQFRLYDFDH
jgi:hypothetical protein